MMNNDSKLQRLKSLTRLSELTKQTHAMAVAEALKSKDESQNQVNKKIDQIESTLKRRARVADMRLFVDPSMMDIETAYFDRIKNELTQMQDTLKANEIAYTDSLTALGKSHSKKKVLEKKSAQLAQIISSDSEKKAAWDIYRERSFIMEPEQ